VASDDATSVTAGALGMAVAILFLRHQEERDNMLAKCDSPQENVGLDQNLIKIEGDINDLYSLGEVLGEGGFGQVYKARRKKDGLDVAIKMLPKEYTPRDDILREARITSKLKGNPHICQTYSVYESDDNYWLVMELIQGGELFEHLIHSGAYSEAKAAIFLRQFAEALSFVHASGVVHGDLKPENLLLSSWNNEDAELKLVDFGCSVMGDDPSQEYHSTVAYDPPEKRTGDPPTPQSDVWAAGCILYVILTGSHPFDRRGTSSDEEIRKKVQAIKNKSQVAYIFDDRTMNLTQSVKDLLLRMLDPDPKTRISAERFRRNRWVQGLTASWDTLDGIDNKLETFWKKEFKKKILQTFKCDLTDVQLLSVFQSLDTDGSGSISLKEFKQALKGMGVLDRDISSIFNGKCLQACVRWEQALCADTHNRKHEAVNIGHDGDISFAEFKSVMTTDYTAIRDRKFYNQKFKNLVGQELRNTRDRRDSLRANLRRLFATLDLDGNGSLDCHELRLLLRRLGVEEKEISLLVASVDTNKDGMISFDEFVNVMFDARAYTK